MSVTPLIAKDPNSQCRPATKLMSINTSSTQGSAAAPAMPIIISVEAAIGTGKSSLLRLLQSRLGGARWVFVQEPVEQWQKIGGKHNLLEAYYNDQSRFAFSFQTNCVLSRITALKEVLASPAVVNGEVDVIVMERCWHSDRQTFGEMLRRQSKISELEWALYDDWFKFAVENAPTIDGHLYLEARAETCMARLRKRDRTEEVGVTTEYQNALIDCHEEWFSTVPADTVRRIGVDCDFINREADSAEMILNVQDFIESIRAKKCT